MIKLTNYQQVSQTQKRSDYEYKGLSGEYLVHSL